MGKDNQPKHRQHARDLRRRAAIRQPFDRLLIVCEGEKTEPQYLEEIRQEHRLATAHVQVQPGAFGTEPLQLVRFAEHLFRNGDRARGIDARAFDRLIVVFDRDQHETYHQALNRIAVLDGTLANDEKRRIPVEAIASVPCFELWLLLHFEDVHAPIERAEVYRRLKQHLSSYEKAQGGHWSSTKERLADAIRRAGMRAAATTAHDGQQPYTAMHLLVERLVHLRD